MERRVLGLSLLLMALATGLAFSGCVTDPMSGLRFACDPRSESPCSSGYVCVPVEPGDPSKGECFPEGDVPNPAGDEGAGKEVPDPAGDEGAGTCAPTTEICDGLDNNCDGTIDEGFSVGEPCVTASCVRGRLLCTPEGKGTTCSSMPSDTWIGMAVIADGSRYSRHTAIWTGSEMIVWGGYLGGNNCAGYGHRYDRDDNEWSLAIDDGNAPSPRFGHTAVWTGAEMIIWGGTDTGDGMTALGDGRRYLPHSNKWLCMDSESTSRCTTPTGSPTARYGHTAIWTGSKMIIWGGRDAGEEVQESGAAFDPEAHNWSAIASPPSTGSLGHCAVWADSLGEMLVWGGIDSNGSFHGDGARYRVTGDTWVQMPAPPGSLEVAARRDATCAWTGSELLVVAGTDEKGASRNDGAAFNLEKSTWRKIAGECTPRARREFAHTWTGDRLIVWGGGEPGEGGERFNTGGVYDPSADLWWATAIGGAPVGQGLSTAIWTGEEMIVWGGEASVGGRYRP